MCGPWFTKLMREGQKKANNILVQWKTQAEDAWNAVVGMLLILMNP